ncbi:MAG: hypothetical protein JNL58_05490 [Planctomyces sp.]|nr:hypothetical protein [Planctomyces sp.]
MKSLLNVCLFGGLLICSASIVGCGNEPTVQMPEKKTDAPGGLPSAAGDPAAGGTGTAAAPPPIEP